MFEVEEDAEGDVDLGVDDALRGEVADHVVGDELVVVGARRREETALKASMKPLEVLVDVEVAGVFEGERDRVVAGGELEQGLGGMVPSRWRWSSALGRWRSQVGMSISGFCGMSLGYVGPVRRACRFAIGRSL